MPRVNLPTDKGQYTNTDEWASGQPGQIINLLVDEHGTLTARPGLLQIVDPTDAAAGAHGSTDQRIIGLYPYKDKMIVVRGNRRIHMMAEGGTTTDITTDFLGGDQMPTFLLEGGVHPSQAGRLLIFGGGSPLEVTPGFQCRRWGTNAPPATHGAVLADVLVTNEYGSDVMRHSTPADHNDFANSTRKVSSTTIAEFDVLGGVIVGSGATVPTATRAGDVIITLDDGTVVNGSSYSGFFRAYSSPDAVTAIASHQGRLWIFGPQSLEYYNATANVSAPFARADEPADSELGAPYSLIKADGSLWWLDGARRLVRQGQQAVSLPVEAQLRALAQWTDCRVHHMEFQGHHLLLLHFDQAKLTLVYDYVRQVWTEWRRWSNEPGNAESWVSMPLLAYAYHPDWNRHFCGGNEEGDIFELDPDTHRDDGDPRVCLWRGPYFDGGTAALKYCKRMQFTVDCGVATTYTESGAIEGANDTANPEIEVRWRNEDRQWQEYRALSTGRIGYRDTVRDVWCRTSYRRQQIEWRYSAPTPLRVSRIELEIEPRLR